MPEGLFPRLPGEMIFGKGGVHAGPRAMAHSRHGEELHENFGQGHVIQEVQKDASSEVIRLKKHLTLKGESKEAIEKRIEEVKYPAYGKEEELLILNNARIAALNDMDYIRIATGTEQSGSRVSSPKNQIMYSSKGPANQALKKLAKKIGLEQKVIPISEQGKAEKVQLKKIIDEHVEPMLEDVKILINITSKNLKMSMILWHTETLLVTPQVYSNCLKIQKDLQWINILHLIIWKDKLCLVLEMIL